MTTADIRQEGASGNPRRRQRPTPSQTSSVKLTRLKALTEESNAGTSIVSDHHHGGSLTDSSGRRSVADASRVLLTEMTDAGVTGEGAGAGEEDEMDRHSPVLLGLDGEDEEYCDSDVDLGGVDIEHDNGYDTDLEISDHGKFVYNCY